MDTTAPDATTSGAGAPARGTAIATLGMLMAAGGPILLLITSFAFGVNTDAAGFFLIPSVLGLVGAWLVRRDAMWAKGLAILLVVVLFTFAWWMIFGLALPASFFDFVPGTLVLPGVLLAIVGAVLSIVARKSGRTVEPGERRAVMIVLCVVGLLAVVSAVLTTTGRDTVPDAVADQADLSVVLEDFEFDEASYDVPDGGTIFVKNDDPLVHTFTVEELGIDVDLGPYSEKLIEVPEEPGTFVLICDPHTQDKDDPGEDDMASKLTVG